MRNNALDALVPPMRRRFLVTLFRQPANWWYLSELAAFLGTRPSSLQRELAGLLAAGILESRRDGNRVYFRPQRRAPIFSELHSLIQKTAGVFATLQKCLEPFGKGIELAFVFGSVARNQQRPDSDVDLMIVGNVTMEELIDKLHEAEHALGRDINVVHYSGQEFRRQIGKGDHFLKTVLKQSKQFVIGSQRDLGTIAA